MTLTSSNTMDGYRLMTAQRPVSLTQLTRREQEIAQLFAQGLTHKAIATQLFISPKTARNHLAQIYCKLGVSNKIELPLKLAEDGS